MKVCSSMIYGFNRQNHLKHTQVRNMKLYFTFAITSLLFFCCSSEPKNKAPQAPAFINTQTKATGRKAGQKVIHVFVALCDNKYQG
ncbi:MAG: hypothetical protein ABI921_08185, partial [Panacibacter sp.]